PPPGALLCPDAHHPLARRPAACHDHAADRQRPAQAAAARNHLRLHGAVSPGRARRPQSAATSDPAPAGTGWHRSHHTFTRREPGANGPQASLQLSQRMASWETRRQRVAPTAKVCDNALRMRLHPAKDRKGDAMSGTLKSGLIFAVAGIVGVLALSFVPFVGAVCCGPLAAGIIGTAAGYYGVRWSGEGAGIGQGLLAAAIAGVGALIGGAVFWL